MSDVKDQKRTRLVDTCEWIRETKPYKDWENDSGAQTLVITAPPGHGKSVLAKYLLLETFQRSVTKPGDFVVLDHFCQGTRDNRTTALEIVQSLLYQLLVERRHLFNLVPRRYMKSIDRNQELPFETLWNIFVSILKNPQIAEAYCLIDGLDECEHNSDRILLESIETSFISQGTTEAPLSNLIRFVVTTRPSAAAARLGRISRWCDIQVSDLDDDIKKVVDFGVQRMSVTHVLRPTVAGIITNWLSGSANGTFLWVQKSLDDLKTSQISLSESQIMERLLAIPKDMEEVYSKDLQRIEQTPETRDLAKKILSILMFSYIDLDVHAFAAACCDWPQSCTTHAELLTYTANYFEDSARTACGSFIQFVNGTIQFFHHTALQYLLSRNATLGSFSFDSDQIHCDLARICIRYLLLRGVVIPEVDENKSISVDKDAFPLLEYALGCWFLHLRESKKFLQQHPDLLVRFFDGNSALFKKCIQPWTYLRDFKPANDLDTDALVFHSLVLLRQNELIRRTQLVYEESLSNAGHDPFNATLQLRTHIDTRKSDGTTPLMLAARNSALTTAMTLLELGANANLTDDDGKTALHIAARGLGHDDIELVKYLIPKTEHLDARNKHGYSAFLLVSNKDIAETFLDHGIDINSVRQSDNMTLLELAAMEGNSELVATLLRRGADPNHQSSFGWTPLYAATRSGNVETIRLIIEQGVDVKTESKFGRSPLHEVAKKGPSEAVQLLLNCVNDKDVVTPDGCTALFLAAERGNEGAVEIFLQAGVDTDISNLDGYTALHIAASEGRDTIVRKLINKHAKVNTVAKDNSTPLVSAVNGNHLSVVKLLVESGADKNFTHPENIPML